MKKTILSSLVGLIFVTPIYAAENIELDDVVVTAARVPQPRESVIADVTVIDSEEIQRAGQTTLVELLQLQPGVEISSNGGAGKLSTIFMRGTNSGHVVILVDGMRIGSATAGLTALENLPLGLVDRIEVLRGPASSLYGQDAIGGVIQIFTKKGEGQTKLYANLGYGSYQTVKADGGVYGRINDTSFAFSLTASNTNGFSALNSNLTNISDKDGYSNLGFTANVSQKLAEGHEIGILLLDSYGNTQYDNTSSSFSSYAKLEQQSLALTSKNQWTSFWLSSLRVGFGKDKSRSYSSSFLNPDRVDTEQTQINWQNDLKLPIGTLTLMYDRLEDDLTSNTNYDKTNRVNNGYVASYLANIGAHSVQLSIRDDHNSQFGNNLTGGIGYGFSFNKNWRATASYGTAFKAPTFNDLYYPFSSGNPNLKPEKSRNIEASIRYNDQQTNASITAYENNIRDLIVFTDIPHNINKAKIQGVTLAASHDWNNWQVNINTDIQSPRDDKTGNLLARRANRHASLNLNYTLGDWRFGSEIVASSFRYSDPKNQFKLAGYALLNLVADYKINRDWSIQGRLNNALDKDYTLATSASSFSPTDPAYNTPGANLFVNIRYQPE